MCSLEKARDFSFKYLVRTKLSSTSNAVGTPELPKQQQAEMVQQLKDVDLSQLEEIINPLELTKQLELAMNCLIQVGEYNQTKRLIDNIQIIAVHRIKTMNPDEDDFSTLINIINSCRTLLGYHAQFTQNFKTAANHFEVILNDPNTSRCTNPANLVNHTINYVLSHCCRTIPSSRRTLTQVNH